MNPQKPWLKFYGDVPHSIDYPKLSMYEAVRETALKKKLAIAYDFFGYTSNYGDFIGQIDKFADALTSIGLKKGDRVTISMPTSPQGIICFYAVNKLGAIASMIHPLSTVTEIESYVNVSKSRFALTIDAFYDKFRQVMEKTALEYTILTHIQDYLTPLKKIGFNLTKGRQIAKVPADKKILWWKDLMKKECPVTEKAQVNTDDLAVILYSGGTTGKPKGIMLSNYNFIAEGLQCANWVGLDDRYSILAILPIFHGFGLGVCINSALVAGGKTILVPTFTPEDVAKLIKKKKPSFVVGVPTLFEALNNHEGFRKTDLSCLKACFSGADSLPKVVKEKFEQIVASNGGKVKLLEGYGLTEAVTAIMAIPVNSYKPGTIGVPFPDMDAKIVKIGTTEDVPAGEEGEICIQGPAVMLGYLDQPEETAKTLIKHADGKTWLHTGDIGYMDTDGFFFFKLRHKRMIKSSGMNVYPAQVEEIIYSHPDVKLVCVIGVPDKDQVEKVKAFVVLNDPGKESPEKADEIIQHCRKTLIKWSCPREVEFRKEIPLTLVGKVAFKELENQEIARLKAEGKYTGDR
jgi:long-chain acyl-CoA synthetase